MQNEQDIESWLRHWQTQLSDMITESSGTSTASPWKNKTGSGNSILVSNALIEKGGVNFSKIHGSKLPAAATAKRPDFADQPFTAMGVSTVIHPNNPHIPTAHANLRFFTVESEHKLWWFGGGYDLTPYFVYEEDCILWHQQACDACATLDATTYKRFKKNCDTYFYLPHRNETRGIGGIFFDDLNEYDFDQCFEFIKSVGANFIDSYTKIINRRQDSGYTEIDKQFQAQRRGRYVEFNLLYDRGTKFGLEAENADAERILMSLPKHACWDPELDQKFSEQSHELKKFLKPTTWIK